MSLEIADEDGVIQRPNPTSIYSSKGELVNRFDRFMSSDMVTTDDIPAELKSNPVRSALELAGDLPELYDLITEKFLRHITKKVEDLVLSLQFQK